MKTSTFKHKAYDLHVLKTDKFRKTLIKVLFFNKLKKGKITSRILLGDILVESTKNYPKKRLMALKSEELYLASINSSSVRAGDYIQNSFNLSSLDDKYTEKENLSKALDHLMEVIFNPHVKNEAFDKISFDLVTRNLKNGINSIKENPSAYAEMKLQEIMGKNTSVGYRMDGSLEELKKINRKNLYQDYQDMIANDKMIIYVVGNVNDKAIDKLLKEKIPKLHPRKNITYKYFEWSGSVKEKVYKETIQTDQGQLYLGLKCLNLTRKEKFYILPLFSLILGGGASSKMFTKIREKASLSYTANANCYFEDATVVMYAGIDKKNYDQTLKLMKECLKEMRDGHLKKVDLARAKEAYLNSLNTIEDNLYSMAGIRFNIDYKNQDDVPVRKKEVRKVSLDDVQKMASKIKLDTIYFLSGGKK